MKTASLLFSVRRHGTRQRSFKQRRGRRFSSPAQPQLSFSSPRSTDLGLVPLIHPHVEAIRMLPEVDTALTSGSTDGLTRAVEIFSRQPGGKEHCATLALGATLHTLHGDSKKGIAMLQELLQYLHDPRSKADVQLALSKSFWLNGSFIEGKAICEELLDVVDDLYAAAAQTGLAVNRLSLVSTLDDVFSVRDPFRMVVKSLESMPSHALVMAHLNMGVAEAVYADVVGKERQTKVPIDGAMRSWKQGLTTLKRLSGNNALTKVLEAQLQSNMAWGLLQMTAERDHVKRASEFAGNALKIYDSEACLSKDGLGRTLARVAACYHKGGSAVTAEGLYQAAISEDNVPNSDTVRKLDLRETYMGYANLCRDWEKRDGDAKRYDEKTADIDHSLPETWRGRNGIYSALWFWTPGIFRA